MSFVIRFDSNHEAWPCAQCDFCGKPIDDHASAMVVWPSPELPEHGETFVPLAVYHKACDRLREDNRRICDLAVGKGKLELEHFL